MGLGAIGLALASTPAPDALAARAPFELPLSGAPLRLEQGLEDDAWPGALKLVRFFEIFPGDGGAPPVETRASLIRDGDALFVAVHASDPEPGRIRAPLVDRDRVFTDQDFIQVEIDPLGQGRSSRLFRVNPRGVQGDGVYDETVGIDDFSPDFRYESVARRTATGWTVALRIPRPSLPAPGTDPLEWRVVIFRNYPRAQVHQMASNPIPRGSGCWLCFASRVEGAPWAPRHELSLTPYATLARSSGDPALAEAGADLRWSTPGGLTLDATLWPDFSQIESDVPRIDANARFALGFPEKRPFFMAGSDLFATPIQAVYTRSIADPAWGVRATGPSLAVLLARDDGGGLALVPGPTGSERVPQPAGSLVALARFRKPLAGGLTPGLLWTSRDTEGGGANRVFGPDLDWRPSPTEHFQAQLLLSRTETPPRPELHPTWDGRQLDSHAVSLAWTHTAPGLNASLAWEDVGPGFRADTGFVPQVGVERWAASAGYAVYSDGWLTLVQPGLHAARASGEGGRLLERTTAPELVLQGRRGFSGVFAYHVGERTAIGEELLESSFLSFDVELQPGRRVPRLALAGRLGEAVDVVEARVGRGGALGLDLVLRPEARLGVDLHAEREWLDGPGGEAAFSARVVRARASWALDVRRFVRLIVQHERLRRAGAGGPLAAERLEWSALMGYRLGWRTVAFAGYAGSTAGPGTGPDHQLFFKLAWELRR